MSFSELEIDNNKEPSSGYLRESTNLLNIADTKSNEDKGITYSTEFVGKIFFQQCKAMSEYFKEMGNYMEKKMSTYLDQDKSVIKAGSSLKNFILSNTFLPLQSIVITNVETNISQLKKHYSSVSLFFSSDIIKPLVEFRDYLDNERRAAYEEWIISKKKLEAMAKNKIPLRNITVNSIHNDRYHILQNLEKYLNEGEALINRIFGIYIDFEAKLMGIQLSEWQAYSQATGYFRPGKSTSNMILVNVCSGIAPLSCDDKLLVRDLQSMLTETDFFIDRSPTLPNEGVESELNLNVPDSVDSTPSGKSSSSSKQANYYTIRNPKSNLLNSQPTKNLIKINDHSFLKSTSGINCDVCSNLIEFNCYSCESCLLNAHYKCLNNVKESCFSRTEVNFFENNNLTMIDLLELSTLCVEDLDSRGLQLKGLYRISPVKSKLLSMCQGFLQNRTLEELTKNSPHLVAGCLKLILRAMRGNLIRKELETELYEISSTIIKPEYTDQINPDLGIDNAQKKLLECLEKMPESHLIFFRKLIGHFNNVCKYSHINGMNEQSLSIVFGPTIFYSRAGERYSTANLVDSVNQTKIVEFFIYNIDIFMKDDNDVKSDLHNLGDY